MKKWFYLLPVILMAVLNMSACGDDEPGDSNDNASELIVGSWQSTKSVNWTKLDGQFVDGDSDAEFSYDGLKLSFSDNGSFTTQERNAAGQWPSPVSGIWNVKNNNQLQISANGFSLTYNIRSIDKNTLVIDRDVPAFTTAEGKTEVSYVRYTLKRIE